MGVSTGEGGGGRIFFGECGGELGGVVVGVCLSVGVGVGMRVPVVPGTSVGQLVPFCGVNIAPGITGMATGVGFWVSDGLVFPHSPLGRDVSESPSAKIGEVVNIVVPFVIAVRQRTCRHVMGRFLESIV